LEAALPTALRQSQQPAYLAHGHSARSLQRVVRLLMEQQFPLVSVVLTQLALPP
jgi:hypothetical protein